MALRQPLQFWSGGCTLLDYGQISDGTFQLKPFAEIFAVFLLHVVLVLLMDVPQLFYVQFTPELATFYVDETDSPSGVGGPHSCKAMLLTWAGRCVKVPFSPSERRSLGHVLDPNMKSVPCYSGETCALLYTKVLCVFRMIWAGEFSPELSAIERVVQLADAAGEVQQPGRDEWADDPAQLDSDLSAASVVTEAGDVRIYEP